MHILLVSVWFKHSHASPVGSFVKLIGEAVGFAVVIVGILALAGNRGSSLSPGSVVGVVGKMGSGKSYYATRMAAKRLRRGTKVATNFTMKFTSWCNKHGKDYPDVKRCRRCAQARKMEAAWVKFEDWPDLFQLRDCLVIIDEAHNRAPAVAGWTLPSEIRWFVSQARHFGMALVWVSQHESRVNTQLRVLTNAIYVCNSWMDGVLFMATLFEPESVRRSGKHLGRTPYRLNKRWANLYDTLEILTVPEGVQMVGVMGKMPV